jgi:hypothetical protein
MLQVKNKPEAILPVHTMDRYKENFLESVLKTLHRALQKEGNNLSAAELKNNDCYYANIH